MPDIAMCQGKDDKRECPFKDSCYRYTAKPDEYRQTYFAGLPLSDDGTWCAYLMPDGRAPDMEAIWKNQDLTIEQKTQQSIDLLRKKFGGTP